MIALFCLPQLEEKHVLRFIKPLLECLRALRLDKLVRILVRLQIQDSGAQPGLTQHLIVPERRLHPRFIAVIRQNNILRVPLQNLCLSGREARPERSHRLCEAGLMHGNHIHIPLAQNELILPAPPRKIQSVQISALVKDRRLRRIEIFWLAVPHHTPAEPDHPVLRIHDGVDHAVPELVMQSPLLIVSSHAGFQNHIVRKAFSAQIPHQVRIAAVRIAKSEMGHRLRRQLSLREIPHACGAARRPEQMIVIGRCFLVHRKQLIAPLDLRTHLGAVLHLRQRHASPLRQCLERLLKRVILILHQERDDISPGAAAKAVEDLLGRRDREGRRFFIVKGTKAEIIGSLFFQFDVLAHNIDDVIAGPHLFHNLIRIIQNTSPRTSASAVPSLRNVQLLITFNREPVRHGADIIADHTLP